MDSEARGGTQPVTADTAARFDVLIVGGGHAGAQTAIALRQAKFEGSIAIIGDEPDYPYERPPLSKEYFSGEKNFARILLRPATFWAERNIVMLLGRRVVAVDAELQAAFTEAGERVDYERLVWAAGGAARMLDCPGNHLEGVHTVRTRADVDQMMARIDRVSDVVVIGGGYIGLEAAAVLAKLGKNVTLLEALDRVLARVAAEPLSRFYEAEHRAHGVDIRLSTRAECLLGTSEVTGVRLADGAILPAQLVIVGIGIFPAVTPLLAAGVQGGNGVTVDATCRTSLPGIYAVGDCAAHSNRFAQGRIIRLESVQNASDQAAVAARSIAGDPVEYEAVPWFWSNQYDLKLQTVGLSDGYDELVVRGDMSLRSFSIVYLREGRVIALDCVNSVKDYVQGRALVAGRVIADSAKLRDPETSLRSLVE